MEIKVTLVSVDGFRKTRKYKSIKNARKFATDYVGENPDLGMGYAVSCDGICTIYVSGITLRELFAKEIAPE